GEIKAETGAIVPIGALLGVITDGGVVQAKAAPAPAAAPAAPAAAPAAPAAANANGEDRLSPAVRKLVEENKLDPNAIKASGKDGRLTKGDVLDHMSKPAAAAPAPAPTPAPAPRPAPAPVAAEPHVPRQLAAREERVPMSRL